MVLELARTLLFEQSLAQFGEHCMNQVTNQSTFEYFECQAQIAIITKNWSEAERFLTHLVDLDGKWVYGFEQLGHISFKQESHSQALQFYLKAIRVASLTGQEVTDKLVYQRAGDCYARKKAWEDARVMFLLAAEDC